MIFNYLEGRSSYGLLPLQLLLETYDKYYQGKLRTPVIKCI